MLTALWHELGVHHAGFDPAFEMRSDAHGEIRHMVDATLRDSDAAVFVCDPDPDTAGPAGFCAVRIDRAVPIRTEVDRAEITDLLVRVAQRRRGVGRALVGAAFVWVESQGIDRCEVRVASANHEGQLFWRALGFGDLMDVLHRRL